MGEITKATLPGARPMILAMSAAGLPKTFNATGFHACKAEAAFHSFQETGLWIGPRRELEALTTYRQVIPYIVLQFEDRIVCYRRTCAGAETRLHGRISIGLGGHIDLCDVVAAGNQLDLAATLTVAAQRELDEELGWVDCIDREWLGVLVDNESEVGLVHIGVVGLWRLRAPPTRAAEDAIGDVALCSLIEIEKYSDRLEKWSALLFDYLRGWISGRSEDDRAAL